MNHHVFLDIFEIAIVVQFIKLFADDMVSDNQWLIVVLFQKMIANL
jgi:hypothetical protein